MRKKNTQQTTAKPNMLLRTTAMYVFSQYLRIYTDTYVFEFWDTQ